MVEAVRPQLWEPLQLLRDGKRPSIVKGLPDFASKNGHSDSSDNSESSDDSGNACSIL